MNISPSLKRFSAVSVLALSCSSHAFSAVTLTSDDRYVRTYGSSNEEYFSNVYTPSPAFSNWNRGNLQTSSISTSAFSGDAYVSSYSDLDWVQQTSDFGFSFEVTSTTQMDFSGTIWGEEILWGAGEVSIQLIREGISVYSESVYSSSGYSELDINFSEILSTGSYQLMVHSQAWTVEGAAGFSIDGSFTDSNLPPSIVPMPTAGWLFGSALISLCGLRRKR